MTGSHATEGAAAPARASDPTLHRRILGDIERRIVSGEWAPGFRIPFETDLAAEYGCSRMTVNKVLTQLARAGLVDRKKRRGTFVRQPRAQSAVLEIRDIEAEVLSLALPYAFAVLARSVRSVRDGDRGNLDDLRRDGAVLDVACLHFAGAAPFCLEERIVNLATVPEAAEARFEDAAPGKWLLGRVPWTSAEHRIQAAAADAASARRLQVPRGTACLVVERRTWSGAGSITFVRLTYPGTRHALVATFAPSA